MVLDYNPCLSAYMYLESREEESVRACVCERASLGGISLFSDGKFNVTFECRLNLKLRLDLTLAKIIVRYKWYHKLKAHRYL